MTVDEKKLYKFIYKAIKEVIRAEIKASESRIVEHLLSEGKAKEPAIKETMSDARKAIQQGMSVLNGSPSKSTPSTGNVLKDLISSTSPLSEQGSVTSNLSGVEDIHTMPPTQSTGNDALDAAMAAPFKDYSAFMKKVEERNKTRKG